MNRGQTVTVDRAEFKEAVSWTRRGQKSEADLIVLFKDPQSFKVRTELAETAVKSTGYWPAPIAVNAGTLKRLVAKLPRAREVALVFSNGRLQVGPTLIPAWAVLPVANGNIERPIDEARQKEKPRPARRGRMPGIEAVRDELTYDEMLHLADVVEGWMLDHRTRRDKLAMLERMADELRDLAHELGPKWNPSRQPQRPSLIGFLGQMLGRN